MTAWNPSGRLELPIATLAIALVVTAWANPAGLLRAQGVTASDLRALLEERVGDIDLLRVPALDDDLPQPRLEDDSIDPRFEITEDKRFLGKFLFHDPIRSNNILPEFGGDMSTAQTASCGSCHFGEAGSKAGQVIAFGVGGEGRMAMDQDGKMTIERTMIEGFVDLVPTPLVVTDDQGNIVLNGASDQVDAVPRLSPSVVGFAYNERLLLGGVAGEPYDPGDTSKANLNPDGYPAGENLAQIASTAHRMEPTHVIALQGNVVYRELFARAFPDEYALFEVSGDVDDYINSDTIFRALAAYMRTAITRETPWDRFLAGDDQALSEEQLRGAWVFAAETASGGANCLACHSGPALNKTLGDEAGDLIEENFYNLGLNDHPLQALAAEALGDPDHHDLGRQDATGDPADAFKFKSSTLRQLRDSGQFMHSGELESLREVIEYFNAGIPASSYAAAAGNVTELFTDPRGGTPGLGLAEEDIGALEEFLAEALFDPSFVFHDPDSATRTFDPNVDDLTYDAELLALGAVNGLLPSGMAVGNDDDLTREQTIFVRGRANGDTSVDLADSVFVLNYLFLGGPGPEPMVAADFNADHKIDLSDPIYLLDFLFLGGPILSMPYPAPGQLTR